MSILKFEEITAWQKSKVLCVEIYKLCANIKDFGFNSQIQRASVSIMNNIAEGFERNSNNEFRQFLYISKGSCGETKSMILLSVELGYLEENKATELISLTEEISKMLFGLIKSLKTKT